MREKDYEFHFHSITNANTLFAFRFTFVWKTFVSSYINIDAYIQPKTPLRLSYCILCKLSDLWSGVQLYSLITYRSNTHIKYKFEIESNCDFGPMPNHCLTLSPLSFRIIRCMPSMTRCIWILFVLLGRLDTHTKKNTNFTVWLIDFLVPGKKFFPRWCDLFRTQTQRTFREFKCD